MRLASSTAVLLCAMTTLLTLAPGCRRAVSKAAPPPSQALNGLDMVETSVAGVGTFLLPDGWHLTLGQYPSDFGEQYYQMVRTAYSRDEDEGLLSIDISPSHPRLWRRPLTELADSRLAALGAIDTVEVLTPDPPIADLPYQAEQRLVDVGGQLQTVFRIFRQKSRVITVAYTAGSTHFDPSRATDLVHAVSDSMLIDLPIVEVRKPDLRTERRPLRGGVITAAVPWGWRVTRHRTEESLFPTDIIELTHASDVDTPDNDRPTLTISILRLSYLGPGVEVEGLAAAPGGREIRTGDQPHATVLEVDDDTLAAIRVVRVQDDVVTATYAAPDYLFEVKPALELLENLAASIELPPVPDF